MTADSLCRTVSTFSLLALESANAVSPRLKTVRQGPYLPNAWLMRVQGDKVEDRSWIRIGSMPMHKDARAHVAR